MELTSHLSEEELKSKLEKWRQEQSRAKNTALAMWIMIPIVSAVILQQIWGFWPGPNGVNIPLFGVSTHTVPNFILFFVISYLAYNALSKSIIFFMRGARFYESQAALIERRFKFYKDESARLKMPSIEQYSVRALSKYVQKPTKD
jgi:hypothetical protein